MSQPSTKAFESNPNPAAQGQGESCDLSVVIPAYNERERLPGTLDRILAYLQGRPWSWEVLVADDGSHDGTPEMVETVYPLVRVVRAACNQGKGAAVRRGMLAARGRLRLFSDADLSTPIDELDGMIPVLERGGFDVVIASRALPESQLIIHQPWWREKAGRFFNRLVQPLSGLPFVDTQCGFKLFRAAAAELIFTHQQSAGWAFDVEILMLAQLFNLSVLEYPVRWINNEASKVSLLRAAPRMIRDILRFRWRRFTGQMAAGDEPPGGAPPNH